uniref:ADP-ribose pyrophosphatase n=1 Tax=viral metagenome TaxID=1070528 RepID=A0A6M3XVV1_9ZZZZ
MHTSGDRIISETKLEDDYLGILRVDAILNGMPVTRTLIEHPSGSVVLAFDPDRKVAAVLRQTRLPVLRAGAPPLREPAAGALEDGETPEETAIRECLEETGIKLKGVEPIGEIWMDPSSSTERSYIFLGSYSRSDRVQSGGGVDDENEEVDLQEESLADLWRAVEVGGPMYANMLICLQALRLRRPALFI